MEPSAFLAAFACAFVAFTLFGLVLFEEKSLVWRALFALVVPIWLHQSWLWAVAWWTGS
jgi:hypothetical protein